MTGAPGTTEPGAIVFLDEEEERGFTEDEAYAFLSGGMDAVRSLRRSLTAAANVHTGAMVAFVPSQEDLVELVVLDRPGAEPLEQLHITAVYLGDAAEIEDDVRESILEQMTDLATRQPLIIAKIFGFGVFNPDGPEPAVVAHVGGDALADAHNSVTAMLEEIGVDLDEQHEPWVAHLTLGYPEGDSYEWLTDELTSRVGNVAIDRIRVAFAGVITDIPLGPDAMTAAHTWRVTSSGYNATDQPPTEGDDAVSRRKERGVSRE